MILHLLLLFTLPLSAMTAYQEGVLHLNFIVQEYPELISHFGDFRQLDAKAKRVVYKYGSYGKFSPTTLRCVKVAGDLLKRFGNLSALHIAEAGSDHLQRDILSLLGGFASYTLIDSNSFEHGTFDLLIGNEDAQRMMTSARAGYITLTHPDDDLVTLLYHQGRRGSVERELPTINPTDILLSWHSDEKTSKRLPALLPNSAVSYTFSYGGRFGDHLLSYFHAKWLAYKYGLAFAFVPFPHSHLFHLHEMGGSSSLRKRALQKEEEIPNLQGSWLHVVPFFQENRYLRDFFPPFPCYFDVDWEDPAFHAIIAECLTPKEPIATLELPTDCLTVAIHVRRGGGYDTPEVYQHPFHVLKFPPDDYYIDQLKRFVKILDQERLFVYLFTDDKNPAAIVQKYASALNDPRLEFFCRPAGHAFEKTMFEDFLSIPKFDCIILPQSNFSFIASKLGDYALTALPVYWGCNSRSCAVNSVELTFNGGKRKSRL